MTRPRVTLKLATSLDGRIATAAGESQWITGEAARTQAHRLRAAHDAVLVGVETVLADDPRLTVRIPGHDAPQPLRVVLDSRLRTPPHARLAGDGEAPTLIVSAVAGEVGRAEVAVVPAGPDGRPTPAAALDLLAARGVARVMIEGGGEVAAAFLRAGLVDAVEWFRAPVLLGGEGRPCVAALSLAALADAPRFRRLAVEPLGDDLWERYEALA